MGYFVFVGLWTVLTLVVLFVLGVMHEPEKDSSTKPFMVCTVIVSAITFVVVTIFCSTDTVANGHIGIKKQFSSLVGTTGEGLVTHAPWQSVDSVSVQNELRTYDMTQNNSAVSADSQPVFLTVQVNYSLQRDKAVELYRETGGHFVDRILDPAVYQNVKAETANYKAIDFARNREAIRAKIEASLATEVETHGLTINNVSLKNVGFTQALSKAIEATVEAEQNAKAEQEKVKIAQAQASQKVAEAKGSAESTFVQAKADADSTLVQARADAAAQRLKQKTLTPMLVQMEAIQKLNPNVQVIVCDSQQDCVPQAFVQVPAPGGK